MSFHYGQGYPGGPGGGHNPHSGGTYGAASRPYRPPPSAPYASGSPYGGYGAPGQGSPYAQPRPGGAPGGPYGAGAAAGGPYGVGYGGGQPQGGAYRHPGPTAGHAPHGVNPEAYQWFQTVDTDSSGSITLKELRQALVNSNWSAFNDETCLMMINMFDRTRMGRIDVSGFSALWDFLQQWRALFQQYDRDRSGCISSTELHQALAQMGYNLSPQFTETLVGRFNVRGGGRPGMQLDRFIQVCTQLQSMTQAFREKDSAMTGNIRLSYEDFLCGAVTRLM